MIGHNVPPRQWGILGTANIAAKAFLPALRETGGTAVAVGSRSVEQASQWAAANEVSRAISYEDVLADPEIDAVYIALPNDQHARWTAAAIQSGKVVLCEKPLTLDAVQARSLFAGVAPDALVWESFVFPFHPQTRLIASLLAGARIGSLREVVSEFHFEVRDTANIRMQSELGGGALYDVGCYPVRLARLLAGEPFRATGLATVAEVDLDLVATVGFDQDTRLVMSVGMRRPMSTFTRIIGTDGELRVSNPFHPGAGDTVELWRRGILIKSWPSAEGTAFRHAIDHIHAVMAGATNPEYLAAVDALAQAEAMDLVRSGAIPLTENLSQEGVPTSDRIR